MFSPAEFTTPRAILTGHDCEVTCASVCAELGLVISGCKGVFVFDQHVASNNKSSALLTSLIMFLFRGSLSDPFHEWGPAADPGGPGWLPAASPHPVLYRGKLHDLLRQGTVLPLQCQRQTAGTHGGGGQHQGEET